MSNTAPVSRLTSKCQTSVPKEVRDRLHIGPGDRVKWFVDHSGYVFLLPERSITDLKGILKGRRKRFEIDEIEAAATEGAAERDRRSRRRS